MIWIDIATGTWGDAEDLRFVDSSTDFDQMSDSEIQEFGDTNGKPLPTEMLL